MRTHSNIRTLADVRALLDQAGGFIERSHEAVLYLSRVF